MKRTLAISALSLAIFGCEIQEQVASTTPTTIRPKYDYTPPEKAQPKEHDVTFLLIRPSYAKEFQTSSYSIIRDFADNMGKDFEEILTARGYSMRGPFDSWSDVIYQDKQEADLILEVEIQINLEYSSDALKSYYSSNYGRYLYQIDGEVIVSGYINMVIKEPHSQEKLFIRKLSVDTKTVRVKSYLKYFEPIVPFNDVGINNDIVPVMEEVYGKILQKSWIHLHPSEILPIKEEAIKLREKKDN